MSTYTPIASTVLTSNTSSITFNVPNNYTDLVLIMRGEATAFVGNEMRFNNDSGSNYSVTRIYSTSSSTATDRFTNATTMYLGDINTNHQTVATVQINNYANPNVNKTVLTKSAYTSYMMEISGLWRNIAPITTITLFPTSGSYTTGSTFNLYGIQEGGGYALGGDIVRTDGTYWYHAFLSSGAFVPNQALTVDYLVVAGGGAGGNSDTNDVTGGGGAGGYRTSLGGSTLSLSAQTYAVTVGAGGAMAGTGQNGGNGTNSTFSTISASGGGGGGGSPAISGTQPGSNGGSGGGGGDTLSGNQVGGSGNAGGYSPVEGYAGGNCAASSAGGGGGAGGVGQIGSGASSYIGGTGGIGATNAILNALSIGQLSSGNYYVAGGGGGGAETTGGTGGIGGGGTGGQNAGGVGRKGVTGTANTGGGGGGSRATGSGGPNTGGSGIVIVRYAV
jgi:hypothetical protein